MKKILNLFVLACVLTQLDGCIIVRDIENVPVEDIKKWNADGPGEGQYVVIQNTKGIRSIDTGKRMAYGFFPGWGDVLFNEGSSRVFDPMRDQSVAERGATCVLWTFVGNAYLGLTTAISTGTMIFMPKFRTNEDLQRYTFAGVFGRHDWTTQNNDVCEWKEPVRYIERQGLAENKSPAVCGRTGSGYPLYFDFPGFDIIEATVSTNGAIAVMFEEGPALMRVFTRIDEKDIVGGITFTDYVMGDDEVAQKQILHQREMRKFKDALEAITRRKEYKCAANETRKRVSRVLERINEERELTLPSKDGVNKELSAEYAKIEELLNADYVAAMKRKREAEIKRVDEQLVKVASLRGSGKCNEAISICDKEIEAFGKGECQELCDLGKWEQARKACLQQEIERVNKAVERLIGEKDWQASRDVAGELNQWGDETSNELRDCRVKIESSRLNDVIAILKGKIERKEWWQVRKEANEELESALIADIRRYICNQIEGLEYYRDGADKAIREERERIKEVILVQVSRNNFAEAISRSKTELSKVPDDDAETKSFWESLISDISIQEEQYRKQKQREEAEARARERERRLMNNSEYKRLKNWYEGQLSYNDINELNFIEGCPYTLILFSYNSPRKYIITYNEEEGWLKWPGNMAKGFAEDLIKARIRMYEIEKRY